MILADKIIRLRKRNGWSQEELAAKMNVSRQAVSKMGGCTDYTGFRKNSSAWKFVRRDDRLSSQGRNGR